MHDRSSLAYKLCVGACATEGGIGVLTQPLPVGHHPQQSPGFWAAVFQTAAITVLNLYQVGCACMLVCTIFTTRRRDGVDDMTRVNGNPFETPWMYLHSSICEHRAADVLRQPVAVPDSIEIISMGPSGTTLTSCRRAGSGRCRSTPVTPP